MTSPPPPELPEPATPESPDRPEVQKTTDVSPRGQEVEYALVLSRIIDEVKSDPAQLRWAIYEVARARLKIDSAWLDRPERLRLADALETAIEGVESFSARSDSIVQVSAPSSAVLSGPRNVGAQTSVVVAGPSQANFRDQTPRQINITPSPSLGAARGKYGTSPRLLWFVIAVALIAPVTGLVLVRQQAAWSGFVARLVSLPVSPPTGSKDGQDMALSPSAPKAGEAQVARVPTMPLPTVYGVYALDNGQLSELDPLAEQVPDKRVAVSTPVTRPSRVSLPDGKVSFVVYRRDMADNAPDRIEVRVVARVTRALTFGEKGQGSFTPVNDAWNIRNIAHEFRVRPVPGSPEMLLIQADKSEFSLPAGRYVLVLKNQGYDFTVAGDVTDPSQCLERTEAANGVFYSECKH